MDQLQLILITVFYTTRIKCVPIPHYDPYAFVGPTWNVHGDVPYDIGDLEQLFSDDPMYYPQELRAPYYPAGNMVNSYPVYYEELSGNPKVLPQSEPTRYHSRRRRTNDLDYDLFASPDFPELIPTYHNIPTQETNAYSPELQRLMMSYQMLQDYYKRHGMDLREGPPREEMDEYDSNDILTARGHNSRSALNNGDETAGNEQSEDLDDYYDDNSENAEEGEEETSQPSRRTFGILVPLVETGITMLSQDLGLGPSKTDVETDVTQTRQTQMAVESLRRAKEQAAIDTLRTQQTLESLKTEVLQDSLRKKAEIDSLKLQIEQQKEQKEQERREKEEIRMKLEQEASLREREREDLKRKYELEVTLRQREAGDLQRQIQYEARLREQEKDDLKRKLEIESAIHEANNRQTMETYKTLEMKTNYDAYLNAQNQKIIEDYRMPAMGYAPAAYYVNPLAGPSTVEIVG